MGVFRWIGDFRVGVIEPTCSGKKRERGGREGRGGWKGGRERGEGGKGGRERGKVREGG